MVTTHLWYLAAPYNHTDPAVRQHRFERINITAARLMAQGIFILSPISHTHPIALAGALPTGWGFWDAYDTVLITACFGIYVLMLDGWQQSVGVTSEIQIATTQQKPVIYLEERT